MHTDVMVYRVLESFNYDTLQLLFFRMLTHSWCIVWRLKPRFYRYLSCKPRCYARISSPEKTNVTTHVQNTIFFHVCLISPIGCRHVTRLSRHSVGLTNERQSLNHSPQSIHTMKNPFRLQSGVQTFLEGEENQNTKIKTERYVFSCFGDGISFRPWNESFQTQKSTSAWITLKLSWLT